MPANIKIDIPLALVTDTDAAPDAIRLFPTGVRVVNGDPRSYFVMLPPTRLLIVLRNGLTFADLAGMQAADALIGWDQGNPGFVREVGKQHTKITILGPATGLIDTTLSTVIADAPPNQPETRNIILPASTWARIDVLGRGDTATGIIKALQLAEAYLDDD